MSSGTLSAGSPACPFALEEVLAAVRALRAGEFRDARPTPDRPVRAHTRRSRVQRAEPRHGPEAATATAPPTQPTGHPRPASGSLP